MNRLGARFSFFYRIAGILAITFLSLGSAAVQADHTAPPASVAIAGSLQDELGCPGDWQPDCVATELIEEDGIWQQSFALPAGDWEYKAALNDSWDENYGANATEGGSNIPLSIPGPESVKFYYDHNTHWITDNANSVIATAVGSFQDELGCPGDWQPDCLRSWLQDPDGDGIYEFGTSAIPAGDYEAKVAHNESWDENYGAGGVQNGPNIPFSVGPGDTVRFEYDLATHILTITIEEGPLVATAVGSFQDEVGCPGDWQPDCAITRLLGPDGSGNYLYETTDIPAGDYEAKVTIDESWDEHYGAGGILGGDNIPFSVEAGSTVVFAYDPVTHILAIDSIAPEPVYPDYAIIHYYRDDGDYGDHTSGDFNDYWGLHLWGDGIDPDEITDWTAPKPFLGEDEYGRFAWVKLAPEGGGQINFIVHRGDIKDGTNADRYFNSANTPEIWIRQDDGGEFFWQAVAQGYVTIRYHRPDGDYGDPTSGDFNDFWGLHLWGDAVNPSELTEWTSPKKPVGLDDYGVFFQVLLQDASLPVNFILHRGDTKDPGPDQSFVPQESATAWIQSADPEVYEQRGAAEHHATIHYHRDDGDYGDPTSNDFNDFWGLHVWAGAANPNPSWTEPLKPTGFDIFGAYFAVPLEPGAPELAYILHRGDTKDPGPDQFLEFAADGYEVWQLSGAEFDKPYILPVPGATGQPPLDINDEIDRLEDAGILNAGQANALRVKLAAAEKSLEKGKKQTAINQLNAFINQVLSLVAEGVLPPEEGELLIGLAEDIILAIS